MAGDWIKWEKGLERKPEIVRIARSLDRSVIEAAGSCMLVWSWADGNTTDGVVAGMTAADVSTVVGIHGIGEAMASVGWLVESESGLQFPNYVRHNGQTSKARALDANRKRVWRMASKASGGQPDKRPVNNRTQTGRVQG